MVFREHERVLLKRQDPLFPLPSDDDAGGESGDAAMIQSSKTTAQLSSSSTSRQRNVQQLPDEQIALPIIMPFLTIRQRAKCQLVCRSWRDIVLEKGVAVVVDVNDVGLFPKDDSNSPTPSSVASTSPTAQRQGTSNPSRSFLRGVLNHSHSSLVSLVLNDFASLQPDADLHPALPHLKKLQRIDISRVPNITDDTLDLIATHIGKRLRVLYMKGLRRVTNSGVVGLIQSCTSLRVLDVSRVYQLDDTAGVAIGTHLQDLEVLNSQDSYLFTNRSVDLITRNCRRLIQCTLWGCIKLTNVRLGGEVDGGNVAGDDASLPSAREATCTLQSSVSLNGSSATLKHLVLLNLWGCHNLTDEIGGVIATFENLRTLNVSECHKLTDKFVAGISSSQPAAAGFASRLMHLQLRYLRRITDVCLEQIVQNMTALYSLDLSFCTKLTVGGLTQLLCLRTLAELRLYSCRQLEVEGGAARGDDSVNARRNVSNGCRLAKSIENNGSNISFLDLRECQQHELYRRDDVFLRLMAKLGFSEILQGLFIRPACCNEEVKRRLVDNFRR